MFRYQAFRCLLSKSAFCKQNIPVLYFSKVSSILRKTKQEKLSEQFSNINRYVYYYARKSHNDQSSSIDRTLISHKYMRLIKNAIRESGPVAELNPKLSHLLKNAEKSLPHDFIQFAFRISCENRAKVGLFDLLLSSGCHFLIQYEDIDSSVTKHHLLKLCEKFDGTLIQGETIWPRSFEQKGIILVQHKSSDSFSDFSKETLSEMGVQSLSKETDVTGEQYWKIYCDPWLLPKVKEEISKISSNIAEVYVGYLPKGKINLSPPMRNYISSVFVKLAEVPTIDKVYTNTNLV